MMVRKLAYKINLKFLPNAKMLNTYSTTYVYNQCHLLRSRYDTGSCTSRACWCNRHFHGTNVCRSHIHWFRHNWICQCAESRASNCTHTHRLCLRTPYSSGNGCQTGRPARHTRQYLTCHCEHNMIRMKFIVNCIEWMRLISLFTCAFKSIATKAASTGTRIFCIQIKTRCVDVASMTLSTIVVAFLFHHYLVLIGDFFRIVMVRFSTPRPPPIHECYSG